MSIPKKDSLLVPYSTNFSARILAANNPYQIGDAQAETYETLKDTFVGKYNTLMDQRADGTRSEAKTAAKNTARRALLTFNRELYSFVQANSQISDENKILLGVTVRNYAPTPIPAPTKRPIMEIVAAVSRTVTVAIHGSITKTAKPAGATNALVYSFVGVAYPSDPTLWQFQGSYGKPEVKLTFPDSVANGAQVWVCAAWVNRRGDAGPVSVPITTNVQGGGVSSATSGMKIAA